MVLCHGNINGKAVIVALLSDLALFCTEKMWIGTQRKPQKVLSPETELGRMKRFLKVNCHGAGSVLAKSTMEQDCDTLSLLIDAKEIDGSKRSPLAFVSFLLLLGKVEYPVCTALKKSCT